MYRWCKCVVENYGCSLEVFMLNPLKHILRSSSIIKEDCKFEFRVSLKEEKKEKQIDNKEGKNLSVGFLYKVFP